MSCVVLWALPHPNQVYFRIDLEMTLGPVHRWPQHDGNIQPGQSPWRWNGFGEVTLFPLFSWDFRLLVWSPQLECKLRVWPRAADPPFPGPPSSPHKGQDLKKEMFHRGKSPPTLIYFNSLTTWKKKLGQEGESHLSDECSKIRVYNAGILFLQNINIPSLEYIIEISLEN